MQDYIDLYVFADNGSLSMHKRPGEHRIRQNKLTGKKQNPGVSRSKSYIPKKKHCSNFKIVAPILEALNVTQVFRDHRISDKQKTVIQLFTEICENQGIPVALERFQLELYLLFRQEMNYTPRTVCHQWHPICKLSNDLNWLIPEDIHELYHFVYDNTTEYPDKKLPVSHKLLAQQITAIDKFITPGCENTLAKAVPSQCKKEPVLLATNSCFEKIRGSCLTHVWRSCEVSFILSTKGPISLFISHLNLVHKWKRIIFIFPAGKAITMQRSG